MTKTDPLQKEAFTRLLNAFYAKLSPKLTTYRDKRQKRDRYDATNFSVFDYIDPDENRLSEMLRDLLDPSGTHGQGPKFLTSFLTKIGLPQRSVYKECRVKREDLTHASRRVDITIRLDDFAIGIENKPWAFQAENQLDDYWKHLRKLYRRDFMLVYLSGDGSDPVTLRPRDLANLQAAGQFKTLAYSTDLRQWLDQCHQDCKAEKVKRFLRDFADYVDRNFELAEGQDSAI